MEAMCTFFTVLPKQNSPNQYIVADMMLEVFFHLSHKVFYFLFPFILLRSQDLCGFVVLIW